MTSAPPAPLPWSTGQKTAFRFFTVYFLVYLLPLNSGVWADIVPWVGRTLLRLPYEITVLPNGSGDTTFNYVQVLCFLVVALVGCLVWSLLDRRRAHYRQALYWLLVLLRYYLAMMMFLYGFAKIDHSQFPSLNLFRLAQPLGQFSPMGLAWTFMGYSTGYNWFTGTAEVVGGFFLLFRRTTPLAGVILLAVIGNIVALNFAFDIPVKLFSMHLLLMTVFILVPDAGRLVNVLMLNRPAPARDLSPVFTTRRLRLAGIVVKTVLIGGFLAPRLIQFLPTSRAARASNPKPSLRGLYQVTRFHLNGDSLLADSARWRQAVVDGSAQHTSLLIRMANDSLRWYQLETDTVNRQATLYQDTTKKYRLHYQQSGSGALVLSGRLANDSVFVRLRRQADDHFLLVNRGFHWINERPFNR
ncbi:hypothetical protein GCM10027299_37420 [Larkinella ripae]